MKKTTLFLLAIVLHTIAVGVIIVSFLPMAKWYFENPIFPASNLNVEAKPLWGVDFYYTVTLTRLLRENFTLPPAGWGYAWFTGWPLLSNYPLLHYYVIAPLSYFFGLIPAVKLWMLVSSTLFFVGLYATCYALSRNIAFSLILAIAAIYSVGTYGTLMWGGSLPNHATQAFLPWVVFFLILYLKKQRVSYLLLSSLLTGLAILGHPQIVIAYIYPFSAILLVFSFWGIPLLSRIKALFIFVSISFLIGLPVLYTSMGDALKVLVVTNSTEVASSTVRIPSAESGAIAAFHKAQPLRIYGDTNTTVFVFLGAAAFFFLVVLFLKRQVRLLLSILPFLILTLYSAVYIWIFSYGISIYHGGWYRLFWVPPLWLGMLASSLWGSAQVSLREGAVRFVRYVFPIGSLAILLLGSFFLLSFSKDVKERIIPRSNPSSAFPDILNMHTDSLGQERLKKELVPSWIPQDEIHFRIYGSDQTVNIWWNSLFKMPLARGYLDAPVSAQHRGYFFWLDAALSQDSITGEDQLVGSFKYPPSIALNNTLFLIDWYAIKFFEAGHAGPTVYAPLPKWLSTDFYMNQGIELEFNKEKYNTGGQTLHYYQLRDQYVSPILLATNAPTLGVIATDQGYETVVRGLADMNLGSKEVIPIKLGSDINKLSTSDLTSMDALILYDYTYSNRESAFGRIGDYVGQGKKVFIDSGVEVKESQDNGPLPEIFPIEKTFRKPIGASWNIEMSDERFIEGVDFSQFDPPLFDTAEWKFSHPQELSDVRSNTQIILKNHGIPLMISQRLGEGEVVWSGLNFPYHVIRFHNHQEVQLFKNIITYLMKDAPQSTFQSNTSAHPAYEASFKSAQKREVRTTGAFGVLFKEQAYPGWIAKAVSGGKNQNLKIFKAGPAYPGFMYVRLPLTGVHTTVTFTYVGSLASWVLSLLSLFVVFALIEEALLGGRILGRLRKAAWKMAYNRTTTWWKKEDEE